MATSSLEERMARIEGAFEQIDRRLTTLEQDVRGGFDLVNNRMDGDFDRVNKQFDRVNDRIDRLESRMDRWQMSLLGAVAASILATVLTRLI